VHSSAQVGNVLRVMVSIDQAAPDKAVGDVIKANGLKYEHCSIAKPGLEDVFVAATRARKDKR
jgi:hypothetical protein